ncbi:MAG: LEA type 2 family protein [Sphingobacteriales bacterium]|nr:LEA type 2 family protein [Sphingobacteriales bacterium]
MSSPPAYVNYSQNDFIMKIKALLPLLVLSVLVIFAPSCRAPKDLEYHSFKNLQVDRVGFSATYLKLDLVCYNPNNFGLQLKSTDLEIWINNNYLGHTAQEYQVNIPKRGEFILPLQIEVDMKNMLKNAISSLANKEVLIKATGNVKVGKANVFKNFVVNYESLQKITLFQ